MSIAPPRNLASPGRWAALAVLATLGVGGALALRLSPGGTAALVQELVDWLRGAGIAGPLLFALLQVLLALSGALPASLMGIAAGAVYGLMPGFLLATVGTMLGAVLAFGLSRSLLRSPIESRLARQGRLRRLDAAVAQEGWKLVCLLRLSPVMPFSATSFVLGLSSVRLPDYLVGTLAALPALFGYVFLGTLTNAGVAAWSGGESPLRWAALAVGGVATLLLTARLGRLVLQRQLGRPAGDLIGGTAR